MKAFWFFVAMAVLDAMALGSSIARLDALSIVLFLVGIIFLLWLAARELHRRIIEERWEAARIDGASQHLRGTGAAWPGGDR